MELKTTEIQRRGLTAFGVGIGPVRLQRETVAALLDDLETALARVAELEAENERIAPRLRAKIADMEGRDERKTRAMFARIEERETALARVAELEAENERLRAECAERTPHYSERREPPIRPLTTADRMPEVGDVLIVDSAHHRVTQVLGNTWWLDILPPAKRWRCWVDGDVNTYLSRADGGPVTVTEGEA